MAQIIIKAVFDTASSKASIDALKKELAGLGNTGSKINIDANTDKAEKSVNRLSTSVEGTGNQFSNMGEKAEKANEKAQDSLKKTGREAETLGHKIMAFTQWYIIGNVVSGVQRAFSNALDTMREVDSEMVNIRKVTDLSAGALEDLEEQAYETASAYGVAADEYLSSVTEFARAGYEEQSEALAELAIKTQLVGDVSQETANQFLLSVDAAYQYKGSIEELTKVLDGANEIDNKYATSIEAIAEGMGIVAPVAAQAHVGVDELAAAIGTITAVTQRSGSEAARAFRALVLNIIGDTKTEVEDGATWTAGEIAGLRDILEEYAPAAVAAAEATGEVINPMEALAGLAQSMEDGLLTEQKLMEMVSDIGGKLRTSQLLALIQNWDMYESMLSDYAGAMGSADREVENALDSWDAKINILNNSWTQLVANTVDTEFIKGIIDGINWIVTGFDNLIQAGAGVGGVILIFRNLSRTIKGVTGTEKIAQGIKEIVKQGKLLKTVGTSFKSLSSILGGVLTIFSVVTFAVNKYKQAQEEARQATIEAAQAYNDEADSLADLYSKVSDETLTRDELVSIMTASNTKYAEELDAINDVNEAREKAIELIREENLEKARDYVRENTTEYNEAVDWMQGGMSETFNLGYNWHRYDVTISGETPEEFLENLGAKIDDLREIDPDIMNRTTANTLEEMEDLYGELSQTLSENEEIIRAYEVAQAILNGDMETAVALINEETEATETNTTANEENAVSLESIITSLDELAGKLDVAGSAFDDLSENGKLSYSTLSDIRESFGELGNIDDYIERLADAELTADELNQMLGEMTLSLLEQKIATGELNDTDAVLIERMLEEAGVTNAAQVAMSLLTQATRDGKAAKDDFNNTSIDTSKEVGQVDNLTIAFQKMAGAAALAAAAAKQATGGASGEALLAGANIVAGAADQLKVPTLPTYNFSTGSSSSGGSGGGSSSEDDPFEKLKDELDATLQDMDHQIFLWEKQGNMSGAIVDQYRKMQAEVHALAEKYRQMGLDENSDYIQELQEQWWDYQDAIEQMQEDLWDELTAAVEDQLEKAQEARDKEIEALDAKLEAMEAARDAQQDELELQEKELAVLEAQKALEDAKYERTIRRLQNGVWEWVADEAAIKDAQDALDEAQSDLDEYKADLAYEAAVAEIEARKEAINAAYDALEEDWEAIIESIEEPSRSISEILADIAENGTPRMQAAVNNVASMLGSLSNYIAAAIGLSTGGSFVGGGGEATHDYATDTTDYSTLMENATSQAEFDYWAAERDKKIAAQGIDLNSSGFRTNAEIAAQYGWKYDSGGVLRGTGGIKATESDEVVLGPELTRKILTPVSNTQFTSFAKALGLMFGVAQKAAPQIVNGGNSTITNTDSHAVNYYINGVKIGRDMADKPMSQVLSVLKLNVN